MIPYKEMREGYYRGYCAGGRGPHIMYWDSDIREFRYLRYKFGWMVDKMRHEEDPNRYEYEEGFIPIEYLEEKA